MDGKVTDFSPRFREAAYTPIKKAVGQDARRDVAEMTAQSRPGSYECCGEEEADLSRR